MSSTCLSPYSKLDKLTGESMAFPCGKCYPCLRRRVSGWSYRLVKEGSRCDSSFFVTFTYDTRYVPITPNGFMTLRKRDWQLFMKKLRKIYGNTRRIKYFAVGEYGGKTNRPHYHAIIFNADINDIEATWVDGKIHVGTVQEASIGYTLKYMMKKGKIPLHKNDDRLPEFQLMSKGLGENYLTDSMREWHHNDLVNRMYVNLPEGKKIAMPRYYKNKLYSQIERRQIGRKLSTEIVENAMSGQEERSVWEYYDRKMTKARLQEKL